jgi:hypothetical protein
MKELLQSHSSWRKLTCHDANVLIVALPLEEGTFSLQEVTFSLAEVSFYHSEARLTLLVL